MPTPPVAIAVVSWNTRDLLDRCLESLRPDAEAGLAEVWVVDNGSTDGSRELARERHPWARLLCPEENLGYGAAVNLVAARSEAPWLVAANADTAVTPGTVGTLLRAGEGDPRAGAVAPRLILLDGSTQPSVFAHQSLATVLVRVTRAYRLSRRLGERYAMPGCWDPERPSVVPVATGAFLALRRAAFDAVGRFDESMWLYAEDMDVCWRLRRAGWVTRYEPAAVVHHAESAASRPVFGEALPTHWMRATWSWMARRQGLGRTWAAAALSLLEASARVAVLGPLARRHPDRFALRREVARHEVTLALLGLRSRRSLTSFNLRGGAAG